MKRLLFYCQHILGMGHLVRSMEIVRSLTADFEVCFINGGEIIDGFQVPPSVRVINLFAIKSDSEFQELQSVDPNLSIEYVKAQRQQQLSTVLDTFEPDVLIVELFPFGRRRFSFELIPLIEAAKTKGTKIVSSLRDIVVTKRNQARHEAKVVRLLNHYFDQLLIHGDPALHAIEESFSRIEDVNCEVHYTGYVVQKPEDSRPSLFDKIMLAKPGPMILVSVGGGRFGHELLNCVVGAAEILKQQIPHHIQVFTGPFMPEETFWDLKGMARDCSNLNICRYTPTLLSYMQKADLSISMSGYNTTMNILTTGVKAMMLAFTGNGDQEQSKRVQRLSQLGKVRQLQRCDLQPQRLAAAIITHLQHVPSELEIDLDGANKTAQLVKALIANNQTNNRLAEKSGTRMSAA